MMIVALAGGVAIALGLATSSHGPQLLGVVKIDPPLLRLVKVASFDQPVYVTAPPGDRRRLFVVERTGRIRVMRDGRLLAAPFLDLTRVVKHSGTEDGFLSMAFAPDYAKTGRFYVDYTGKGNEDHIGMDNDVRVLEYRRSTPERANPRTRRLVVLLKKPFKRNPRKQRRLHADAHNGGLLLFGPDRLLYISIGDGGTNYDKYNNAQNLGSLLGKILRIDPRPSGRHPYRIPPDNPFTHRRARGPRSMTTGCATRGASPSTRAPAPWPSPTSERAGRRRSTSHRKDRPPGATTAGACSRAFARAVAPQGTAMNPSPRRSRL